MTLLTTESTLMHSALAVVSPTLRQFDALVFKHPHDLPPEILLHIRWYLVPALIEHYLSESEKSMERYETNTLKAMCAHCVFYNEYVYGRDIFLWHPCACVPGRPPQPDRQFRGRSEWLETRFVGIWDVVTELVDEFGCDIPRRDAKEVVVVPRRDDGALGRLKRDMGLGWVYDEPRPKVLELLPRPTPPPPPRTMPPRESESLLAVALDALTAPLRILACVLCYYLRPRALRLL